jgi:single-strand DNA-binding protein
MYNLNEVKLIGHLASEPELKHTPAGKAVTNFSLATNEEWTDRTGKKEKRTEFHRIECWGATAENVCKYQKKGSFVLITGKLRSRSWDDKRTGIKRYVTEIVADTVGYLSPKDNAENDSSRGSDEAPPPPPSDQVPPPRFDDEIPF